MSLLYHNLSDLQFEELVIEFCVELLGHGVQGFVTGKDGGRDARFEGTAKLIPSEAAPWTGKVVVQAKHTELLNKSFSEGDFSGTGSTSTLGAEIARIKLLIKAKELDHYILFSNRRLTGVADAEIRKRISEETGLPTESIRLYDESELDRLCKRFPESLQRADLNPAFSPPEIDPRDLANVIAALSNHTEELDDLLESDVPPPEKRITPSEKNQHNGLSDEYFKRVIRPCMVDFPQVQSFLAHPDNKPYVKLYDDTAEEFEEKLVAWNKSGSSYERLLVTLVDRLFARDFDLRQKKKLTRTLVYYMYCNCDFGNPPNDTP